MFLYHWLYLPNLVHAADAAADQHDALSFLVLFTLPSTEISTPAHAMNKVCQTLGLATRSNATVLTPDASEGTRVRCATVPELGLRSGLGLWGWG